ncbi:MAG: NAD-dependent epimerase/dehydratase family protein [Dehalococcoidia bacterium]|nr:NAD-dependent epimerase/dehydratase family protein [Dehalococcoidia bacterium]
MKVLVTGATGFIGGNLARELWRRGDDVQALVRPGSNRLTIQDTGITPVEGDILDRQSIDRAIQGCEAVYHVAAVYTFWSKNPAGVSQANVQGTKNVLEAARQAGVSRTVYTSTVGTIGIPQTGLGDEDTPLDPKSLHGHYKNSKHLAEQQALAFAAGGMPVVVVNPTLPVGPWDVKPTPTGKIVLDFLRCKIPAYLKTGMNIVDVADVVVGHILALEKGRPGERYILGNQNVSLKQIFDMLSQLTGLPAPRIRAPYWLVVGVGYADHFIEGTLLRREPVVPVEGVLASKHPAYVTCDKAINQLGLPQSSVTDALKQSVDWFVEHGYVGGKNLERLRSDAA